MIALGLGLVAALLWGVHDYCVRILGDRVDALGLLVLVFSFGAVLMAPVAVTTAGWDEFTPITLGFSTLSGLFYAAGAYGLYRAFAIGPVRLVAPISGGYPLLSVTFHMARGGEAGLAVWVGVLAVVLGIALVTRGEPGEAMGRKLEAVSWALLAAFGFALTFGFSQWAAETSPQTPVIWIARLVAVVTVLSGVLLRGLSIAPVLRFWRMALVLGTLDTGALMLVASAGAFPHAEYAPVTASMFGIVTVLLAWRFLGEAMRGIQWIGILGAFAGLVLLSLA